MGTWKPLTAIGGILSVAAAALVASASEPCCQCGGNGNVRKICRVVPDQRKVEKTVFGCKCSEVCLPGRACRSCLNCAEKAHDQASCDGCDQQPYAKLQWFDWMPNCGSVKPVKQLVLYKASTETCGWKWKTEEVCDECCPACNCAVADDGTLVERPSAAIAAQGLPLPPVSISPAAYLSGAARK